MCCSCCKRLYMAILTCLSIGLVLLALVAVLIYIETKVNFDQTVEIISIVCVAIAGVILIFAIYASCCGKNCALNTLGVIYIVFLVLLVAGAICIWVFEEDINKEITEIFLTSPSKRTEEEERLVESFEGAFQCCGYGINLPIGRWCSDKKWEKCNKKLDPAISTLVNVVGSICCVAAFFMLCGVITAFVMAKKKKKGSSGYSA